MRCSGVTVTWPAQPARRQRRVRTPPEPAAGRPETHAGARCWSAAASSRSRLSPPAISRRSRHRCATRTSTWRSLATHLVWGVSLLSHGDPPIGSHEPFFRADHFNGGGSGARAEDAARLPKTKHLVVTRRR